MKEIAQKARLLLGFAIYEKDGLSKEQTTELFDVLYRMAEATDPFFYRKHSYIVFLVLKQKMDWNDPGAVTTGIRMLQGIFPRLFPHSREFYSAKKLESTRALSLKLFWRRPVRFPPKKHVGVGYSDYGSQRDSAHDGSPHWSDVATDEWYQLHVKRPGGWTPVLDYLIPVQYERHPRTTF